MEGTKKDLGTDTITSQDIRKANDRSRLRARSRLRDDGGEGGIRRPEKEVTPLL